MDAVPDRVRAVRDARFKYLRNYQADLAYFRPLTFRDMFPVMKALWAGDEAGSLSVEQSFYFSAPRPDEELYDTVADPHEVRNLAGDPRYEQDLQRLRAALDDWLARVGDMAQRSETAMIETMWPGGRQPVTIAPSVVLTDAGVALTSDTVGASIGYRLNGVETDRPWLVYAAPVVVPVGAVLEAKAVRYGYAESAIARYAPAQP